MQDGDSGERLPPSCLQVGVHHLPCREQLVGGQPKGRAARARHAALPPSPCTAAPRPLPCRDLQPGGRHSSNLCSFSCAHPANAVGHLYQLIWEPQPPSHLRLLSPPSPNPCFLFAYRGGLASVCMAHHLRSSRIFRVSS